LRLLLKLQDLLDGNVASGFIFNPFMSENYFYLLNLSFL